MQENKNVSTTGRSFASLCTLAMGTALAVAVMVVVVPGCNIIFPPANPCTGFNVDDGNPCTVDTCVVDSNGAATAVHTAVVCSTGVCNETTGECVECNTNADCGTDDVCATYMCDTNNTCVVTYTTNGCDDGDDCTHTDVCSIGVCEGTAYVCTTGLMCDGLGGCVECLTNDDCTGTDYCTNGVCTPLAAECNSNGDCAADEKCVASYCIVPECTSNGMCDDGVFCNGEETCNLTTYECEAGTPPCDDCDTTTDTCPSQNFILTTAIDIFTGSGGDDLFLGTSSATNPTFNLGDSLSGGGGTDTLRVVSNIAGAIPSVPTTDIEIYEFQSSANDTFAINAGSTVPEAVNFVNGGNTTFNALTGVKKATAIGLKTCDSQITVTFNDVTGTSDEMTLNLNGATANSSVAAAGIETFNVYNTGAASTLAALTGAQGKTLNLTGDKDLTITADLANTFTTINAAAFTGNLVGGVATGGTVKVTLGTGNDRFEVNGLTTADTVAGGEGTDTLQVTAALVAADLTNVSGFEQMRFVGDLDQDLSLVNSKVANSTYEYSGGGTIAVTNNQDTYKHVIVDDATSFIPVHAVNGPGDTAIVELKDADVPTVGTALYEKLTIVSSRSGTTANTLDGDDNDIATALTMAASGTATISGDAALDIADTTSAANIDASAMTAKFSVKGSAAADDIKGGAGDDELDPDEGNDLLTGNGGADVFYITDGTDNATYSGGDNTLRDFEVGVDKVQFDKAAYFGTATGGATATAVTAANYYEGAVASMTAGTTYEVVVLTGAGYATAAAAEDAVVAVSTSGNDAVVVFFNTTLNKAQAYFTTTLGTDVAVAAGQLPVTFDTITTLAGMTAFSNTDFLVIN